MQQDHWIKLEIEYQKENLWNISIPWCTGRLILWQREEPVMRCPHTHTLYTSYSVSFSLIISIPCTYPNYQHLLVYSVRQLCFALPHVSPATHAPQLTPYLPTHQISLHTTQPLALLHHTTSSASSVSPCQLPVYVLQICIHSWLYIPRSSGIIIS